MRTDIFFNHINKPSISVTEFSDSGADLVTLVFAVKDSCYTLFLTTDQARDIADKILNELRVVEPEVEAVDVTVVPA
jgi:hypothetical protein